MRKLLILIPLIVLLCAALVLPAAAQSAIPAPSATETAPIVTQEQPVVVEQEPAGTANIPVWLLANMGLFLAALAAIWDIVKSAIHARSLKNLSSTIAPLQESSINAALKALPPEAQELYSKILDMADGINTGMTELLKVLHAVSPVTEPVPLTTATHTSTNGGVTWTVVDPTAPPTPDPAPTP